jgi:hypothetical protein
VSSPGGGGPPDRAGRLLEGPPAPTLSGSPAAMTSPQRAAKARYGGAVVEIERGRRAARGDLWFLSILALTVTGVATFEALFAAGYKPEGDSPFSTAGNIAQVAVALAGLGLAIGAVTAVTLEKPALSFTLSLLTVVAGVAWWPVQIAVWE